MPPIPECFPFIVGAGRSGTTLVRAMLDSHASMAVVHESGFVLPMLDRYHHMNRAALFASGFPQRLHAQIVRRSWPVDPGELLAHLCDGQWADASEAIELVYSFYAASQGKTHYADKTPRYSLYVSSLAAWMPHSRFVHVVRDGRDVARALADQEFGPNSVCAAAGQWAWYAGTAHRQGIQLGEGRYLEVHYEQLVEQPAEVMSKVCAFVGLDYDESVLDFHHRADAVIGSARGQGHHESLRRPLTRGLRDWRRDVVSGELVCIDITVGKWLNTLGYRRFRPPARKIDLVKARLVLLQLKLSQWRWELRQFSHRHRPSWSRVLR